MLAEQVIQRKQGYSESFKDFMIAMQKMVRPLSYSTRETLGIIKENCTTSLMNFLKANKASDLDMLMILTDENEELEKEREAFAKEQVLENQVSSPKAGHVKKMRRNRQPG